MSDTGLFDFLPALPAFSPDPPTEAPVIYVAPTTGDPDGRSVFWDSYPAGAMVIEIEIRRKP